MEIRPAEKLIMLMLTEIYDRIGVEGEVNTDFLRSALFGGHHWAIDWKMQGIAEVEPTDPQVVSEVVNYLDMYDMLELSYEDLDSSDQGEIKEFLVQFQGFDGNNEVEHMSVARFLVEKMDRFQKFAGRSFNSHAPTLDKRRRMYAVYEPLRVKSGTRPLPRLTREEIQAILAA